MAPPPSVRQRRTPVSPDLKITERLVQELHNLHERVKALEALRGDVTKLAIENADLHSRIREIETELDAMACTIDPDI